MTSRSATGADVSLTPCRVAWLGRDIDYNDAWALQRRLVDKRAEVAIPDTLLLLEHAPVYTAGRRSEPEHVLLDEAGLRVIGIPVVETDRGGQVTYHGPGQLVGYPIISLTERDMGPKQYVRTLESVLLDALADLGVTAGVIEGLTGVWAEGAKVAAIGVKISRGVTMHGFALNVEPDMGAYEHIVACGITDREVTSIAKLLGRSVAMDVVRERVTHHFAKWFGVQMTPVEADAL
jgi:lipoyl(octanoyl) transferase